MILLQGMGYFPVSLYMPTYTSTLGISAFDSSLVLATFNLVSVLGTHASLLFWRGGQVGIGYLCDRMPYVQVMLYSAVFSAVAAFVLLGFASSLSLIFVFVVIFGSLVLHISDKAKHRLVDSPRYGPLQQSTLQKAIQGYEHRWWWDSHGVGDSPPF